ncbi:MAG: type II secretion system protein [Armatimonadota bacterium]
MTRRNGFTVLELLVVIAIIGVLAAVLYPVLFRAKPAAKKVVCLSNLHQCGVALRLYMNDYETNIPPDEKMAPELLKKMPTCCPNDKDWTKGCTQQFGAPMIGSYAYVRSVPGMEKVPYEDLDKYFTEAAENIPDNQGRIWMADIFHGNYRSPAPYFAWKESNKEYINRVMSSDITDKSIDPALSDPTALPDLMFKLCDDGHVGTFKCPRRLGIGAPNVSFCWSVVFSFYKDMVPELK